MKKIALVVDKDNWAFANIAKNIKENLSKYYEFKIIPMDYIENNFIRLFLLVKDYDLIHFFWRGHLMDMKNNFFEWYTYEVGSSKEEFIKEYIDYNKISTAVYDHLYIEENSDVSKDIFNRVKNYYVSSNKLFDIYKDLDIDNKPNCVITDGVSLEKFYPKNTERFDNTKDRSIIIGWCGNSKWSGNGEDIKGLNTILKPAIKKLINEGYNIKTDFADSQVKMISHDKMVDYYKNIDILVCSSKIEGTPNPVLEAMACGVPIISTDVGIVKDALGKKQSKYILKERTVEAMYEKIKYMIENSEEMKVLSEENIKNSKRWTWKKISNSFKQYFDMILESRDN